MDLSHWDSRTMLLSSDENYKNLLKILVLMYRSIVNLYHYVKNLRISLKIFLSIPNWATLPVLCFSSSEQTCSLMQSLYMWKNSLAILLPLYMKSTARSMLCCLLYLAKDRLKIIFPKIWLKQKLTIYNSVTEEQ